MAQLIVHIDEQTRSQIENAAKNAGSSVSQWVKARLTEALRETWPEDFFQLLGSLRGSDLERPSELRFENDARREPIS